MKLLNFLNKRKTLRNGIIFSFFSMLNNGISFILLLYIAKYISPSGYGQVNLFNTFTMLFSFLICLNSRGIIAIDFFKYTKKETIQNINCISLITIFIYLFFLCIEFSPFNNLEKYIGLSTDLQLIALSVCFCQVFFNITLDIWRLEEKPFKYGLYTTLFAILNFVITIIFVIGLQLDWKGRIYAQILISILFFISSLYILFHKGYITNILPNIKTLKAILNFGIPLIPHNATIWIRQGLDRYFINYYYTSSLVGLFSFSLNFANIIQIFGIAFNATNSVFIYKILSNPPENTKELLRKQTLTIAILFISITIITIVSTIFFIPILFPQYSESIKYIVPQCLGALFQCIYLLFVDYIFFYKKNRMLMNITFCVSIIHAFFSFLLTQYSIFFTVYIGMISNFMIAMCVYLYSRKLYKII